MKKLLIIALLPLLAACGNDTDKEKDDPSDGKEVAYDPKDMKDEIMREMEEMKKEKGPQENPFKGKKIEVRVFDNKKEGNNVPGFGYDILVDSAIYVHQPHIPAVPGNQGFSTAEKARVAGEFVAYKIRNNILPPSVSVEELDSLKVLK